MGQLWKLASQFPVAIDSHALNEVAYAHLGNDVCWPTSNVLGAFIQRGECLHSTGEKKSMVRKTTYAQTDVAPEKSQA